MSRKKEPNANPTAMNSPPSSQSTTKLVDAPGSSSKDLHRESQSLLAELGISSETKNTEEVPKAQLKEHLIAIFDEYAADGDLSVTAAQIRKKLESKLNISLLGHRKFIRNELYELSEEYRRDPSKSAARRGGLKDMKEESKVSTKLGPGLSEEGAKKKETTKLKASGPSSKRSRLESSTKPLGSQQSKRVTDAHNKESNNDHNGDEDGESQSQSQSQDESKPKYFQRKNLKDTRHLSLEEEGAMPISLPNSFNKSTTALLVRLETADSNEGFSLGGDTGAVGRMSVARVSGKGTPKSADSEDSSGDTLQIELKGDVYKGVMVPIRHAVMVVSVGANEAKVDAVFDRCVQATYDRNVLAGIQGDRISGTVDVSKFSYEGDVNVNDEAVAAKKLVRQEKKRKRKAAKSTGNTRVSKAKRF